MYKLIKPFLFLLPPELAHTIALQALKFLHKTKLLKIISKPCKSSPVNVFGLNFKNPIGIAAGLDKNGDHIDCLAALGVGFIEVGAITPKPQSGNEKPRLFRLKKEKAIINRMGFNNKGVDYLVRNLQKKKGNCIVGVNLGKNKNTSLEDAKYDYAICLEKVYQYSDFATINISSPNTPDLRKLQQSGYLSDLLFFVLKKRDELSETYNKKIPVLVKIAPDSSDDDLNTILATIDDSNVDGVIANNTSISRANITDSLYTNEQGGLSGKPIKELSYATLQKLNDYGLNNKAIISCGGIDSAIESNRRFNSGANLVQIYTGLIFEGPGLLYDCAKGYKLNHHKPN